MLAVFICFSQWANAQNEKPWTLEFSYAIDQYSYNKEESHQFPTSEGVGWEYLNGKLNYSVGLEIFRKLNDRFDVGVGLIYSSRDIEAYCYCIFCDKILVIRDRVKLDYLKIPFSLRYVLGSNETFKPYLHFGVDLSTNVNKEFNEGFRKMYVESNLGVGLEYRFNDKFGVSIQGKYLYSHQTISAFSDFRHQGLVLKTSGTFTF